MIIISAVTICHHKVITVLLTIFLTLYITAHFITGNLYLLIPFTYFAEFSSNFINTSLVCQNN